jgi:hypothetical protein
LITSFFYKEEDILYNFFIDSIIKKSSVVHPRYN